MPQHLNVLLVEDSNLLAERLAEAIQSVSGVDLVGTAQTEAADVELAKSEAADVIILDLHLKQGTGFGVMRALTAWHLKPCFIIFTNYDLPEYKITAQALGAQYFLDKARDCVRLSELLQEIADAADRDSTQHPNQMDDG